MKRQRIKSSHKSSWTQSRQTDISSPLEDFGSDIEDFDQDNHRGAGYDNVVDNTSDSIEGISDDDLDDFGIQEKVVEDIENDNDNENDDQTTNHSHFKPFKALAGLEQWRPNSSPPKPNTETHRRSELENELAAIEKEGIVGDDLDDDSISTVSSLDDTSLITHSPFSSPHRSINNNNNNSISTSTDKTSPNNHPSTSDSSKAHSFSHPGFSLYPQRQDTQLKQPQAPSFILDSIQNQHTSYKTHFPIKEGGLASMALKYINQELTSFREWQTSTNIEMAKHGSVSKICKNGRLCRLVESWEERGLFFGWCVDFTREEGDLDSKEPPQADDPYLCVFSTSYLDTPQRKVVDMLTKAPYLGIWPPWTNLPILVDGKEVHVHIITKFRIDDPF